MRIRPGEYHTEQVEGLRGGKGIIERKQFFTMDDFRGTGRVFGISTMKPGSSVGYHRHDGDFEAYYILKGHGSYTDNGETYQVGPGDFLLCRDGESHGLVNDTDEDLEYIALILFVKD